MSLDERRAHRRPPLVNIVRNTSGGVETVVNSVYRDVVLLFAPTTARFLTSASNTPDPNITQTLRLPAEAQPIGVRLLISWIRTACRSHIALPPPEEGARFHETVYLHHALELFGMETEAEQYKSYIHRTVCCLQLDVVAVQAVWETMPEDSELVRLMIRKTAARFVNETIEGFGAIDTYVDTQPELRRRLDAGENAIWAANNVPSFHESLVRTYMRERAECEQGDAGRERSPRE